MNNNNITITVTPRILELNDTHSYICYHGVYIIIIILFEVQDH